MRSLSSLLSLVIGVGLTACAGGSSPHAETAMARPGPMAIEAPPPEGFAREGYDKITDNPFFDAKTTPLSTFSIDVDTAAYANTRRFLNQGSLPPKDAVRIEELINYFEYAYPEPTGADPFGVTAEVSEAPWNPAHRLVHLGIQGKRVQTRDLPSNNLVFLLDVSGSMNSANKLPLLKKAFGMLVEEMRPHDRVAIVAYAGAAGLVLDSTPGTEAGKILKALDRISAGGSTAGGAGIKLAYNTARKHFIKGGNNRVILATDGDFNVGESSDGGLVRLIEKERESGVFLTVLGFGSGNYQDAKMEKLSNAGNGNAAYIDSALEARKVLVTEMGGTLLTIAKDVKIQIEFNPAQVAQYRLIGYENRILNARDFNDDTKDAGELGAGHSVTALYEIIPVGASDAGAQTPPAVDPLKYQTVRPSAGAESPEMGTVKLRYKQPDGDTSQLITGTVVDERTPLAQTSTAFRFSSAVAEFGLLLRESTHRGNAAFGNLIARAEAARGTDRHGYRADFVRLAQTAAALADR